ncbi:dCMP deaminase family protein [Candidatus Woesearchaeota archaeon]|nr:dCMP deaminase family protein [Candidatus Woesearchaeota archaeon]
MSRQQALDDFFLLSAYVNATRSKCVTRQVGAVLVLGDVRMSDGYNGTPRGIPNCNEGGCLRCNDRTIPSGQQLDKCICIHAESNAILNAYTPVRGATLYVTTSPCLFCAKEIIQAGIVRVIYDEAYHNAKEIEQFLALGKVLGSQHSIDPDRKKGLVALFRSVTAPMDKKS